MIGGIAQTISAFVVTFYVGAWLVRVVRGDDRVRDERGRLRPGYAAAAAFGIVLVLGVIASSAFGSTS